ncbi:fibronectin type III domain-containing protein [Vibrio fluvialis]|uniref:fibronectin type III domain-containing protein n=1 Tax=Vibrio fluvialis TaxID=676 RepID=UPI001EEB79D5|nr:fibronectin type III domain-containing protein [Vibrio fluvialis]MCG6363522.1 fibronectin type III domain-containing protein [Vibrio fluvialis]
MGLAAATVAWISVGLSVGATIYTMTQMPNNKSNDSIAGTKVTKNGTQSPRNRVYGTAIVGCTYVYSNVLDRDQSYRLDVFSVGGVGAVRFHNVWIDDVKMFDENKNDLTDPANASSGIYDSSSMRPRYKKSDGFKMQWRSGQENQVAAKLAIDNSDGEWTVNHRGACVPHIVIYADYSTDQDYVFFSDRYNINALVTGAEVFDPRTGQVNGESSNTALATLDFLMNDYYGMGVTVDYINMESFKYGATFCEKNDLRINSAIDASAKFADILQDMLACCGGALAIVDGKITFLVEEKVLAPVYELDEDNILKNSLKVSPADSSSYYNVVSTTFKSEINRDNDDDFVIPQNAASDPRVMADGKIITKSLKMPYARDAYESEDGVVQHCVKYMTNLVYNKAKFQMSCSFDIDLHKFSELRPWDVIGVSSEIYGFKNKLFRVQSMKVATDADRFNIATIHCIEYDHSVYEGTVEGTGSLPRPKPDDNVPAPKNVMFTLSSFVNTGYGLLAWEASCFTPSTAYDIEYKLSSASKWTRLTSAFRGTQFTLTDLKEARYDFRVRTYELFLGSSDWTTITNINVRPAYVIPEVTGLKVETSTPNFKFTWDDMTNVEVDNIPSSDAPNSAGSTGKLADVFHQYSIQIVVNGVMKYATTTKESTFTLDLEKNKEMMGGQPSRVITFRISIEDRLGNSSLVTELVANNRQIGVAGDVDVTNANGSATVEWSPCFEPDFAGTEVHISTTKGFTPSASTLHATLGKESFYVFPFPDKTTRYMRIAHFDTMGRDGLHYSPEITLTYDGVESAKSVRLISDSQTFHVNKSGVAAPSLIIMSAFTQNVEGSVTWTASPSVALATTSNPNERVLKYASMGNHDSVKVTVTVDGVTDTVTICKVRDGHDGQDGQDGSNGQDGNTIYEQYRYGQVINPDASWTAWGADMRTSDIYRQTRRVINDVPQAAGRVHRIAGMDGSNGADGERLFVVYHKNPVNQRPMPPEGAGNTGGWTEDSDGANWMSQKLANTIDQPLTFWSFPIQMKGNDGEVDYSHVDEIAEAKKNEAIEASIASATASVEAAEVRAKAYADGVATDAEKAAIAAADAKANAAETKAKAYADGVVSEAEQAAIAEAERLAAQAEANAKAASDPKGTAAAAQSAAQAYAKAQAEAAELRAKQASDPKGSASAAQQAAIAAADAKVAAAKTAMEAYADGVATDAEQAAIAAANSAANAAEVRAKAYADGEVTKAEQAAIDEAERLAAEAKKNATLAAEESTGRWSRNYTVSATKFAEVLGVRGAPLPTKISGTAGNCRYLVTLTTLGTATQTEYAAWLTFNGTTWTVSTIKASGTSSNHPVLFIQDNKPYIKTYHTNDYMVRCVVEDQYVSAASVISQSTKDYAQAQANAAETKAKAYADGIVTESEQAAIDAANAAVAAAETRAKAYADGVATEAEQAAITAADAKAKAAETRAKAYADGEVTKAEQAAIDEAERLANAAKAHADAEMKKERKRQFDPHLTDPLKTFSKAVSGSPDVISTLEGVGNISVVSGVTGGNALSLTGDHWIYSTAVIPVDPNKKYKMVVKVRQTKDKTTGGSAFYAGVVTLDRNYNNLSGGAGTHRYFCAESQTLTVAGGWRTFEGYIQGIGDARNNFRAGTAYVRPMFIVNYSKGNGVAEVDEIRFYEVTERGDLVDLGFETTQGAQDKANAAKAAAEAYAKARAEAALGIQFTHSGYIERDGLNFRKKSNNNVWDGWASSKQTFTGGCSVTFTAGTTNVAAMCGITTPNMGGASYTDIDFCFYLRSSGVLGIYENGTNIGDFGNYAVGTVLTIRYDGLKVRYYVNGVLKREVGTSAGLGFVADMSIYNVSTAFPIQGLTFTDAEGSAALAKAAEDAAKAAAQQNLDSRIPQANADALKTMMSNEGLRYYRKITVGGEANKYYPVIIHGGSQDKLRTVKIWRSYAETAPNSWHNSTHKGALMLTWQGNFGGWGGATYRSTILEHSEAYSTIFADCYIVNHSMGFAFFLRGGGAVYHIASDMDIAGVERTNPSGGGSGIYLDGTLNSYVHATSPYNAPDALTAVNSTRINDLKTAYNGKGQYIKNLNADNITAGKIAAQYVHADVYNGTLVNATNIKAGMLDADHINTRTFTGENAIFDAEVYGGILTGAVVRTGSTGARAEMREDGYKFAAYNAQNKPTFYVDANGNVVMNSGSISSDVLSEASRNSNIVTWIGTAGKGGNMQFTDNLALQNDVTYFPITNNYYTSGKNGTLNVQYCAANGYLFQDEKSAVGAAAPAQKTLPADAAPTVYFVDASNTTKGAVIRMTIKYTTQAANGTAASKTNPSGTQGWRKTYAHFHIDNIATRPNVAAGTNVKGYKLCINLGASSIKAALKALNRVPDVVSYSEVAEGGRYLPHSYKLVWSGAANSVTNSWGSGWYMVQGHDRGDWHDAGFIFVLDENHYGSASPRSIFPAYSIYYEYRYDTKIFKSSSGNITRIFKLTGV